MSKSILFIDEDASVLERLPDALTKRIDCLFAPSYKKGYALLREKKQCCAVLIELGLNNEDGIAFLRRLRKDFPATVRMVLTARGDYATALDAVNKGEVFRFMEKRSTPEELTHVICEAIRHNENEADKQKAVRRALMGSIKALMDVLDLVNPEAVGVSRRIRERAIQAAKNLGVKSIWRMEMAILLSHVGCVALPNEMLSKADHGEDLTPEEQQIFSMHPEIAFNLLSNIDRLAPMAEIIRQQLLPTSEKPPLESRILKIVIAIDRLERRGADVQSALLALKNQPKEYDQAIVKHMSTFMLAPETGSSREVSVEDLKEGMVMARDLVNKDGAKLLLRGQRISKASLIRLKSFHIALGILDPIHVVDDSGRASGNGKKSLGGCPCETQPAP